MANETPPFWWKKRGAASLLLSPFARIYGHFAERVMERAKPPQIAAPVLCIGNFTLGGAGKTPLAIAFAKAAKKRRLRPGIVSRGFGGTLSGKSRAVHCVNAEQDLAREVGDEPLLLAQAAPVAVGVNRLAAAEKLLAAGADFIIMDDGFQSRRLYADYALLAVDALRGLGNGKTFPAGPLRAPLPVQLAYSDSVILIGEARKGLEAVRLAARAGRPVYRAEPRQYIARIYEGESGAEAADGDGSDPPENSAHAAADGRIANLRAMKGRRFLAFAGIGNPQKFFAGIEAAGGIVAQSRSFADHHFFSSYDIDDIVQTARTHNLAPATTAKDYIRLKTEGLDKKLGEALVLDVRLDFAQDDFCENILDVCLQNYKNRIIL